MKISDLLIDLKLLSLISNEFIFSFVSFHAKGGLIILLLVLLLKVAHKNVSRTLAVEIGGKPFASAGWNIQYFSSY